MSFPQRVSFVALIFSTHTGKGRTSKFRRGDSYTLLSRRFEARCSMSELAAHWSAVNVALCGLAYFGIVGFCTLVASRNVAAMQFGAVPYERSIQTRC